MSLSLCWRSSSQMTVERRLRFKYNIRNARAGTFDEEQATIACQDFPTVMYVRVDLKSGQLWQPMVRADQFC